MRKPRTLDECWAACIEMLTWMVNQLEKHPYSNITTLKEKWVKLHGYEEINLNCFFCEWDETHGKTRKDCRYCPARYVDGKFNCNNVEYRWNKRPKTFLAKIKALDKKRRGK